MTEHSIKTMLELSQLTGISRPTISKYFNDPSTVRKTKREQIEKALQLYDYRPNLFAVNLNRRKPKVVGIIVPDLVDPFFARLVEKVDTHCNASGYFLMVLNSRGDPALEAAAIQTLLSLRSAGAIVAPLGLHSQSALIHTLQARIPLVFLDSRLDESAPFVGTDNQQSVPLITEHLCRTGAPPTFLEMPAVNHNASERRHAYIATMERLGLQPELVPVPAGRDWRFEEVGYATALRAFEGKGFPTRTILCANDRLALGVIAAAYERGLRVGRDAGCDLRVAGHDDQPLSRYACPPLTTVAQDVDRLGRAALDLLLKRVEADGFDGRPEQVRLHATLVARTSA